MGPPSRPTLRLDVLEQLPTPHVDTDMRTSFAYDACEASGYCLPQTEGPSERRPRPSFRVSQGGSTLSMCHQSQEWAIGPQGVRRPEGSDGLEQCRASDIMEFNVIGQGASSVVRKAIYLPGQCFVALKCISVHEKEKRQQLMNELRLLCDGSTAGVRGMIRYFGAYFSPESSAIKVALEYMDAGSLDSLLGTVGPFPEGILARIAADVLDGLAWLHGVKGLVHRDIKPGNILMNSRGEPKLSDFGISTALELDAGAQAGGAGHSLGRSVRNGVTGAAHGRPAGGGPGGLTSHPWGSRGNLHAAAAASMGLEPSGRGTLCYMSPERLSSQPYGFSADLWSLGMTLLVCATGLFPYATDEGPVGTMLEILDCNPLSHRQEVAAACSSLSPACLSFLAACLSRDPTKRPSAPQARASPWCCASAAPHGAVAAFLAHSAQGGDPASPSRAAAQAAMAAFESLAQMFAAHYYRLLDAPRGEGDATWQGAVGGIYAAHAQLTLVRAPHGAGDAPPSVAAHGPAAICGALGAGGETSHSVGQLDCQPLQCGGGQGADGVLVHASGTVVVAFEQRRFAEVFTLVPGTGDDGRWFVVNHWRREWTM